MASAQANTILLVDDRPAIWTVGHSNLALGRALDLLAEQRIDHVLDVRSHPYSRFAPHFNREELGAAVEASGRTYVFLGMSFGGRPQRDEHYDDEGHAVYGAMAAEPAFQSAIEAVIRGAKDHRLALLCSCGRPDNCHRRLLIGKVLCESGAELHHILGDGSVMVEQEVILPCDDGQITLFKTGQQTWRSTQSVSQRRRLSASSAV
jgi:uncharacterized protein (DUF488 family)